MVKRSRRDKRLNALGEELETALDSAASSRALTTRADGALFVVDASGGGRSGKGGRGVKRLRPSDEAGAAPAPAAAGPGLSTGALIADALAAVSRVKYLRMEEEEEVAPSAPRINRDRQPPPRAPRPLQPRKPAPQPAPLALLWGAEGGGGGGAAPARGAALPRHALSAADRLLSQPPPGGASYNPSHRDHQAALAAALEAELAEAARKAELKARVLALPPKAAPRKLSKKALAAQAAQLAARKAAAKAISSAPVHNNFALLDDSGDAEEEEEEAEEEEEEEEGEGEEGEGAMEAEAAVGAGSAPPGAKKAARALAKRAARKETLQRKRAERALDRATGVERALAAVEAEAGVNRTAAAAAAVAAARAERERVRPAAVLALPLSAELTGTLRGMRPVSASSLLVPAMERLVARGDAGRKSSIPRVLLVEGEGEGSGSGGGASVRVHSESHIRYSKGSVSQRIKMVEFPRNKNFAPAEAAVREALARGTIKGQVLGLRPDMKAQEAASKRVAEGLGR